MLGPPLSFTLEEAARPPRKPFMLVTLAGLAAPLLAASTAVAAPMSARKHAQLQIATAPSQADESGLVRGTAPAPMEVPPGAIQLAPPPAETDRAQSTVPRRHWSEAFALDLSATTWVPLSVGPELTVELPGRLLLQAHVGWMPDLYNRTVTDSLEDSGAIDRDIHQLVDGAVRGATTWRIAAGWRPFEDAGLELTVGYAHVALDGATNSDELLPFVPPDVRDELVAEVGNDVDIDLDSTIHHFTAAAGWRWLIADHLVIRASLGYLQAFDSGSTLDIDGRPDLTGISAPTVRTTLHDHYMRYIKIPVVGLGVGYRFF
jgi:hypothetical protein